MKKLYFAFGMLFGVLLAAGTGAAAAGLMAQPSVQAIYVDGERAYFTAYAIAGNNYVQLREIGRRVDFSVTYDAATDSVRISTDTPYAEQYAAAPITQPVPATTSTWTETQPQPVTAQQTVTASKTIDYSQNANPAIFTSNLTREFYNSARHAYLNAEKMAEAYDQERRKADESFPIFLSSGAMVSEQMKGVCRKLGTVFYNYDITEQSPYVYAFPRSDDDLKWPYVQKIIETAKRYNTDLEKAEYLAQTICDKLEYAYDRQEINSWSKAMENGGKAVCSGYASAFLRMGRAAGLQVLMVGSESQNHSWNIVYCDDEWLVVDLTHYDTSHKESNWFQAEHPKMVADNLAEIEFVKEVMKPHSTC